MVLASEPETKPKKHFSCKIWVIKLIEKPSSALNVIGENQREKLSQVSRGTFPSLLEKRYSKDLTVFSSIFATFEKTVTNWEKFRKC